MTFNMAANHKSHGISLPEVLVSSFIGLMVLGILIFFFIYHSQYFKRWLSGSQAQSDAAVALKGMVETIRLANGYKIYSPGDFLVRRDLPQTPDNTTDDTWMEYRLDGNDLRRIIFLSDGSTSENRVLAREVSAFTVENNGNTIMISLTVTHGGKTVKLEDTAAPRGMSLEGDNIP